MKHTPTWSSLQTWFRQDYKDFISAGGGAADAISTGGGASDGISAGGGAAEPSPKPRLMQFV